MTLHNRSAQALIWTALIAALALPAAAQSTTPTCVGGAVNPTVRAEGYTELAGDGTITCVGGTATAPVNAVPAVNITVSMNTIITSKITSPAFTPSYNEALLLIDEPGLSNFYLGDPSGSYVSNPINNCGSANQKLCPVWWLRVQRRLRDVFRVRAHTALIAGPASQRRDSGSANADSDKLPQFRSEDE